MGRWVDGEMGRWGDAQDEVVRGHGDYAILSLKSPDKSLTINEIICQLRKS